MNNVTRVLVIGQGGREHAIVRQIAQNSSIATVYVVPGSDGIAGTPKVECVSMSLDSSGFPALVAFAKENRIDLVVIGPEQPLADGLADVTRAAGLRVFGPSKEGARLEASKIHAKELMKASGVRTARSFVVKTVAETLAAAASFRPPYVLKADGLAAGKGVFIEKTLEGLKSAAHFLFEEKGLGVAGESALLEEFSPGVELSFLVLTNGKGFISMPVARDHKRLLDDDEGPNTGGMGVVAPIPMEDGLLEKIERDVVAPVIREIEKRDFMFRGVLYFGLMLTPEGPSVLEFNTRFGDPEAQVLMTLLDEVAGPSWVGVLTEIADGKLPSAIWSQTRSVACLVLAAEGYPDRPIKGVEISGLDANGELKPITTRESEASYVIHAGTKRGSGSAFVTNGGRVLNVVGYSNRGLKTALNLAYAAAESIHWDGRQIRRDIGRSVLDRK
ncbi:MAG: phosphoribosylamine--glycine ligase [Deltaproteobacteria bacterium]|nr:phosphoribosylamine--glycine ligase [Deltaproteobacteria bacterium]